MVFNYTYNTLNIAQDTIACFVMKLFFLMGMSGVVERRRTVRPYAEMGWGFPQLFRC